MGWCLALYNKALGFSDQYAEVDIARAPSGRYLGPVVRSGGGFDGYAALVDGAGVVSLQVWLAGKAERTLGTVSTGGSPVGRTLRVECLGPALTVKMDGQEILTATDDRRTGGQVGMLAYGGPAADAPSVEAFRSGEVVA
jgi:hypothetical protein